MKHIDIGQILISITISRWVRTRCVVAQGNENVQSIILMQESFLERFTLKQPFGRTVHTACKTWTNKIKRHNAENFPSRHENKKMECYSKNEGTIQNKNVTTIFCSNSYYFVPGMINFYRNLLCKRLFLN